MSISSIPAPRSDEASRPVKAIFNEQLAQRLCLARENSDEPLIKDSAANVLEAEELLSSAFAEMERTLSEPTGSIPPATNESAQLILKPKAGTSRKLPEHDEEIAEWDALHKQIRSMLFSVRFLKKTGKSNLNEVMAIDATPENDYYGE